MLLLSYCFPPVASPESFVTAKTMGGLRDVDIDVIAAEPSNFRENADYSLVDYVAERFSSVELLQADFLRSVVLSFNRLPLRPDRFVLLNRLAYLRAKEKLEKQKFDVLFTRSQYHSSHLVGLKLKRKFPGTPWVASFSDPWVSNPYEKRVPILSNWSDRTSRKVVEFADYLIFPTKGIQDIFCENNPNLDVFAKSKVVPHSYDEALYPNKSISNDSRLKFAYFGNFYGARRLEPILEALSFLVRSGEISERNFVLQIYSSGFDALGILLDGCSELKGIVEVKKNVEHLDALARMQDADILLLVEAPSKEPSIFLPSKLVDYIGAHRKIFSITSEGVSAELTREFKGYCANVDDKIDICRNIRKSLSDHKSGIIGDLRSNKRGRRFEVGCVSDMLMEVLKIVIQGK
tara:strand:- start:33991 stop:35208 length:1218 start_codon:yes stop_codon:yes gene_type:complete